MLTEDVDTQYKFMVKEEEENKKMNRLQERCEHDWELPSYWNDGIARCYKCHIRVNQSGDIIDYNTKNEVIPVYTKIYRPKYPIKLKWMITYDN